MNHLLDKLKDYPHIQKKLWMWGTRECRDFLTSLTTTNRPNRRGFPFEITLVIQDLCDLHDAEYPEFKPPPTIWATL